MTDQEVTAILDRFKADEFSEEPRWVPLVRSMRQHAEIIGVNSETAWLLRCAADDIVKAHDRIDYLEQTVQKQDQDMHLLHIRCGDIKPNE